MSEPENPAQSIPQPPPVELSADDILLALPSQASATADSQLSVALDAAPTGSGSNSRQLPSFIHSYLREYIALADQKAAFIFAACSALLGYLVSREALSPLSIHVSAWQVRNWLGFVSVFSLAASAIFAMVVVLPRLRSLPGRGLIFWGDILNSTADTYAKNVLSLHQNASDHEILLHCHTLASICQTKYRFLSASMWIGFFAFAAALAFLFFS